MPSVPPLISEILPRVALVTVIAAFVYWANFLLNDPLDFGFNTMDVRGIVSPQPCTQFGLSETLHNLLASALFFASHSLFARRKIKSLVGILGRPYEKSLYSFSSGLMLMLFIHLWTPVNTCRSFILAEVSFLEGCVWFGLSAVGLVLVTRSSAVLPDLGVSTEVRKKRLVTQFPYSIVRHPGHVGFLLMLWSVPAYTVNHLLLGALWTVYVVTAALFLEERDLRDEEHGFGPDYEKYASEVGAFVPNYQTLKGILWDQLCMKNE
ncbi:hypothetical protein FOZ63_008132 [Perkinsus olseni]|uniref:Nuclear envelope membrane protein n=1 Tax=Perkinsus olseni TaxID=32597 RepID=A0A7J6R588_PEROL|nr:hypothetical protein FOZ63_008132 [Perkinsus olseni]KAF4715592.1 hypothetical protein FOZ62_011111 [Perkinsus olseni]